MLWRLVESLSFVMMSFIITESNRQNEVRSKEQRENDKSGNILKVLKICK